MKTKATQKSPEEPRHLRLVKPPVDDTEPEPGEPGSIEQQLDMLESGPLRGDEVLFQHGRVDGPDDRRPKYRATEMRPLNELTEVYNVDMSEPNREGDEMSGDEHSLGLQGGDSELADQPHIENGLPGDESREDEEQVDRTEQHRLPRPEDG